MLVSKLKRKSKCIFFDKVFLCIWKYLLKHHNRKYSLTLQFFFFDPVRYVTNGIGKFSLGGRILIVPKPKEYLMQRANSKMQISVIYLYTQLLIIKLEFRQVLEEKQSHYFMVQHLLYSFSSLSTRGKKTKPLECVHLIFDLSPSYS